MDFLLELDEIQTFMVHENIYDIFIKKKKKIYMI
jgi:hypothetical protein